MGNVIFKPRRYLRGVLRRAAGFNKLTKLTKQIMETYYQGEDILVAFTLTDENGCLLDPAIGQIEVKVSIDKTLIKVITDADLHKDSKFSTIDFNLKEHETLTWKPGLIEIEVIYNFGIQRIARETVGRLLKK